jgi:hypothetical protein
MPKKKDIENLQTFSLAFMGEHINVITNIMIMESASTEAETVEQNSPIIAKGYLLDEDSEFIYLGDNPFEITQAVSKKYICIVQSSEVKSQYDEILENMPDPNNKDIN